MKRQERRLHGMDRKEEKPRKAAGMAGEKAGLNQWERRQSLSHRGMLGRRKERRRHHLYYRGRDRTGRQTPLRQAVGGCLGPTTLSMAYVPILLPTLFSCLSLSSMHCSISCLISLLISLSLCLHLYLY